MCRTKLSVNNHLWFTSTMDLTASLYECNCYTAYEIKGNFSFFSSLKRLLIKRLLLTRTRIFGCDDDSFWAIVNGGWSYVWFWKHSISRNLESPHEMWCTNKALNCLTIFRHPPIDLSNNGYFPIGTSCADMPVNWLNTSRKQLYDEWVYAYGIETRQDSVFSDGNIIVYVSWKQTN